MTQHETLYTEEQFDAGLVIYDEMNLKLSEHATYPDGFRPVLVKVFREFYESYGSLTLRQMAVRWSGEAVESWHCLSESEKDSTVYDWEFIPAFVNRKLRERLKSELNAVLFNCQTRYAEPDYSQFDAIEIQGCIDISDDDDKAQGGTQWESGYNRNEATMFSVYGHYADSSDNVGVDCLTDCETLESALAVASELSRRSGLPVNVYC